MQAIAVLDKVSYIYPNSKETVLKDISLTINKGEFLGIIGATGAGKTTLCLALTGIVPQFYGGRFFGKIAIAGLDSLEHPVSELARHVGIVFEDPEIQITATSVENEIAFALENLCVPREEILRRIPIVLKSVRLEGFEKKNPQELSGGQKQRLAIAAALALQPDLLILDEPTSQLDPIGSQEVFATVRELKEELGVAIVMVSHAAEEMAEFCDRIALLSKGKLLAVGTPDEIYAQIDLLEQNKLRPPEVAQAFSQIQHKGINIPQIPVTLDAGIAALTELRSQILPNDPPLFTTPTRSSRPPVLSVQNLKHTYDDGTEALKNVSLDIHEGEYVLIVGQNGAGKSTLVKHFLNLLKPTSGKVLVGDRDTRELSVSDLAQSIGYLAQNPDNQIFNTSVEKEVAFALPFLGYAPDVVKKETERSLKAMQLWEQRHAHPLSLPKGERGRIVIAALLAMNPEIIIFDEPTTGQDYQGASSILQVSRQLHQMGKTVIVITHHLYLMPDYADRAIVMGKGTILLDAPLRQAYHQTDLLESTYLTPPQSVMLSQKLSAFCDRDYPLITPTELASCFIQTQSTIG
ncbi:MULTISPECIES: ABC transporter ATP-binding protein [Pseudanabaena]|jgi:energy-coupling factor transport system ATP-binding protein|uniref:ABC transporter ATP-binding protein n=1 Tax=Pseudanabaena TaxID=1152 RepID=UPI00247A7093|nr:MULTISPECIES: energy-coupling factor transporter ATPase [Pseudanabaena]MEA5488691.1 energy-coupling factor transporter ATPase [Pseudanabaena sp. CCNP1317]WGS72158.1 energy-coupling factor transporter ATPase [Pseudanabaena galeata CCNP1313]